MKIYISGKISGLPIEQVKQKFAWHECFIELNGHIPINPLKISPFKENKTWKEYMIDDIAQLLECDAIYMLNDWGSSKGARIEYGIAKELDINVYFQGDDINEAKNN